MTDRDAVVLPNQGDTMKKAYELKRKFKLSPSLYSEMEGGGYAQGDEGKEAQDIFYKLAYGEPMSKDEAKIALEAVESQQFAMEAIASDVDSFEEGRTLAAARRSADALARRLREFIG